MTKDEDAIPVKVIDDMIAELDAEEDDSTNMMTHGIIVLQVLKGRWERMKNDAQTGQG